MNANTLDRRSDIGLQKERTALAWTRTALSLVLVAAVMAKTDLASGGSWRAIWLAIGLLGGGWVLAQNAVRYGHRARDTPATAGDAVINGTAVTAGLLGVLILLTVLSQDTQ